MNYIQYEENLMMRWLEDIMIIYDRMDDCFEAKGYLTND